MPLLLTPHLPVTQILTLCQQHHATRQWDIATMYLPIDAMKIKLRKSAGFLYAKIADVLRNKNQLKALFNNVLLVILSAGLILVQSCSKNHRISIVQPHGNVYTKDGFAADYVVDMNKPRFVQYWTPGGLAWDQETIPKGKIDKIIAENPNWEFVFYMGIKDLSDTSWIKKLLVENDFNFPVILSIDGEFEKKNLDSPYTGIGFFCAPDGETIGLSCIGSTMSLFDKTLKEIKIRYGY